MKSLTWLALSYQVPIEPSRCRVYVWRKLKEFGACYLKQGVALLPRSRGNLARFRTLSERIGEMGGEAVITIMKFIDPADEREMVARFQGQSQDEYRELVEELQALKKQLAQNRGAGGYDTARRVARRFGQARSRDHFRYRDELGNTLGELVGDMAYAADDLGRFFTEILRDVEL